jgi:hypothetical protein
VTRQIIIKTFFIVLGFDGRTESSENVTGEFGDLL